MITAKEREKAFRDDWNKLLIKHGAMDEYDHDTGALDITMFTQWDNETDGNVTKEFCEFDL
tara:strand:+ start:48 stop:230 length:183 start_codon:yes stop_codon:yes gene_type:complete